jgi:hypothetical protein
MVRPLESKAETYPKLQWRFLRLPAVISQYFWLPDCASFALRTTMAKIFWLHEQTREFKEAMSFARVALPAKMHFHDSAFIGRSRQKPGGLDPWQSLCDRSLLY